MYIHRYLKHIQTKKYCCCYRELEKRTFHASSILFNTTQHNTNRKVRLDYDVIADNTLHIDETPIVISHGLFGSKRNWRSLSKKINSLSGRKVITYDAVNHGSSSHHSSMSYIDLADDLISLLDELNFPRALIIGHSMGGKTVMTSALRHPDRIEKLIVVDAAPTLSKSMGEVYSYMKCMYQMDMSKIKSRSNAEEELSKVVKSKSVLLFLMANLVSNRDGFSWRINIDALMENYHYIHSFPDFHENIAFKNPTLFVGGSRSYYITANEYPEIYKRFPVAEIKHVQDAGHWVHSDKPNEFLNCISDYIHV